MAKMAIMGEKGLKMVIFHISTTNSSMKMFDPHFYRETRFPICLPNNVGQLEQHKWLN